MDTDRVNPCVNKQINMSRMKDTKINLEINNDHMGN